MAPVQNTLQPAPVWPTSLKVVMGILAGIALAVVSFIQYIPDEIGVADAGSGGGGGSFFVPEEEEVASGGGVSGQVSGGGSSGGSGGGRQSQGGGARSGVGGGAQGQGTGGGDTGGGGGGGACTPGANGGATDVGVTEDKIKLAANVVTDGPGSNFLAASRVGLEAVKLRVNNKEGGICGRTLELKLVNDSWDAARGHDNIRNFIAEKYFALPVVPSSEGLSAAIDAGTIDSAGIPVVGTDGMRKEQYDVKGKAGWVWPVAVATVSQVRIMAEYASSKLGAKTFGIVYDKRYKFGVEGAAAFEKYIKDKLPGATLKAKKAIEPAQTSYISDANAFKEDCGNERCDVVVFLLEPQTAKTWLDSVDANGKGTKMTAGAQPLFNENFARNCTLCAGILVWTGYTPAIGNANKAKPDIARYISDVKEVDPSVDTSNQFLQGAYLGMEIFVKVLKDCSPNLTRACVREKMNSLTYQTDMAGTLTWSAGNHFANQTARAYSIAYDGPTFTGFRDEQISGVDPTPGVVPS